MNTFVLIIILVNANGGAATHHIEGFTKEQCYAAVTEVLKVQGTLSTAIRAVCVNRAAQ